MFIWESMPTGIIASFKMSIKCKVSSTVWCDSIFRVSGYSYTKSHIQANSISIISNIPF